MWAVERTKQTEATVKAQASKSASGGNFPPSSLLVCAVQLVNGFCALREEQTRRKMVDRICRIVELQKCLEKWLQGVPGYIPPCAVFDVDDVDKKPPVTNNPAGKKKRKGRPAARGKKRKLATDSDDSGDDDAGPPATSSPPGHEDDEGGESGNDEEETDGALEATAMASLSASWRPFLRELDFDVFDVLSVGLICGGDSEVGSFDASNRCYAS